MNEFKSVLPDEIEHGGRKIKFIKFLPVLKADRENEIVQIQAVVEIQPPISETPKTVVGIGEHEFEAKSDAFAKAKKLINDNTPQTSR